MISKRVTHRVVDGVRIPGTWRYAFIRNGRYFLTELFIYADGLIDCWGLITIEEFEEQLRTGRVATEIPDGAPASVHGLASWTFGEPRTRLTPELFAAEVRDTIDQLNGRPDSTARCLAAVDAFLADRTEANRIAVRTAFLAIPITRRRFALGDMDRKDRPLRVLVAGPGGDTYLPSDAPVTQDAYDRALAYFEDRARRRSERPTRVPAAVASASAHVSVVHLHDPYPNEPTADRMAAPGARKLRNEHPAPISVGGVDYPSVAHAYRALSVADAEVRDAVTTADTTASVRELARGARRREGWEHARTSVMTGLLRAKFDRHSELAEMLVATKDATLLYDDVDSDFWGENSGRGRNWTGRLLELVRSDLHARQAGIPAP
ncbi:NADAR family protein [Streptomyces sp. NPDC048606]|uniref:NADAR family protein n=1 Tax=Streptomyces sp. NPDC048606 TaxID=3154726 RepID=UPI00341268FD